MSSDLRSVSSVKSFEPRETTRGAPSLEKKDLEKKDLEKKESLLSTTSSTQVRVKPITSSDPLREPEFLRFLCENTVVDLAKQIAENVPASSSKYKSLKDAVEVIEDTDFFSLMAETSRRVSPLPMDVLQLALLEVNNYEAKSQLEQNNITKYFGLAMQRIIEQKIMQPDQVIRFYENFDLLLDLKFGNEDTKVHRLFDKLLADGYLTEASRAFMRKVMRNDLLGPIREIFDTHRNLDNWDKALIEQVAKIGDKFTSGQVKASYIGMSKEAYKVPVLNQIDAVKGLGEFRYFTRLAKFLAMHTMRRKHLSCFADKKMVVSQQVLIYDVPHTVSLALHITEKGEKIVKAVTVSKVVLAALPSTLRDAPSSEESEAETEEQIEIDAEQKNQDVYCFFQEVDEYHLDERPDPEIELSNRPLYKFELVEHKHRMRLEKAPDDEDGVKSAILKVIEDNELDDCTVHTAAWHQEKELMPVEIIIKIGFLLSSRALYGQIEEEIAQIAEESVYNPGELRDLKSVYYAIFVMATNAIIAGWHQNELFKRESAAVIRAMPITENMKVLAQATLDEYHQHKHPGKWLRKSIMTTGFKDPARIKLKKPSQEKEHKGLKQRSLSLEVCVKLFQKALESEVQATVALNSLSYAMRQGMVSVMTRLKLADAIKSLEGSLKPFEGYPHAQIQDIVAFSEATPEHKASLLFTHLVTTNSSGIDFRQIKDLHSLGIDTELLYQNITYRFLSLPVGVRLFQNALATRAGRKMLKPLAKAMRQGMVIIMKMHKKAAAIEPLRRSFELFEGFPDDQIQSIVAADGSPEQKASWLFTYLVTTKSLGINLKYLEDSKAFGIDSALLKKITSVEREVKDAVWVFKEDTPTLLQ